MALELPLTGSDLREIADLVDASDDSILESPLIGRVEVYRPGGGPVEVVGHLVPYDDWYGFVMDVDA